MIILNKCRIFVRKFEKMKNKCRFLSFQLIFMLTFVPIFAENEIPVILQINMQQNISGTTWVHTKRGFAQAEELNAAAVLIHMNTYGGEVIFADSIRTRILNSQIPVYVFIDNNATSAGALISIACDRIFMREGATIGAATVVFGTGGEAPDKNQAFMRAMMRSTAQAHGKDTIVAAGDTIVRWRRDPLIAEAMVDARTVVPGVSEEGRVLSFTTAEAMQHGFCDGVAESIQDVIENFLGFERYELVVFRPTGWDNVKGFFMSSMIQGILIMLIIAGIWFEIQTPGIGFPLGVAVLAAILYFLPLYIDGLAANWEILLFILGIGLIAVEIFVFPGFGIAGISGVILMVLGLVLSLVGNVGFDFSPVETGALGEAFLTVILGLLFGFAIVIYMGSRIGSRGMLQKVALATTLDNESGYIGVSVTERDLIGRTGTARTDLRPSGKVQIDGKVHDAVSEQSFIVKGTTVRVVRYETGQIYVAEA